MRAHERIQRKIAQGVILTPRDVASLRRQLERTAEHAPEYLTIARTLSVVRRAVNAATFTPHPLWYRFLFRIGIVTATAYIRSVVALSRLLRVTRG
jgi:hypothetical protein